MKQADAFTPRKLKVPTDLQDYAYGTSTGGLLTVLAVGAALLLFLFELNAFVSPMTDSSLKLDRGTGSETDLLMLELNVSVPWLSCEVASLDLSDATGFTSLNISKGIAKTPIDSNSLHFVDSSIHSSDDGSHSLSASSSQAGSSDTENTYDDGNSHAHGPYTLGSDFNDFFAGMQSTDIVLTLFYAHWCSYSQQMLPVWEAAAKQLHAKYDPNDDKRIMLASVDCSSSHDYEQLCRQLHVLAFPSVRIFRGGTDVVQSKGGKGNLHLAYVGQRTVEAITSFVEAILPRESHHVDHPDKEHKDKMHVSQRSAQIGSHVGCNLHGTIHARKVPGSVVVTARGPRSFAHGTELNLSHVVHWARFGNEPSTTFERRIVSRLHPEPSKALQPTLAGLNFTSDRPNTSFEHYLQVLSVYISFV